MLLRLGWVYYIFIFSSYFRCWPNLCYLLDHDELLPRGLVYHALFGQLDIIRLRGLVDQLVAVERFLRGFLRCQGAEHLSKLRKAGCFGVLEIGDEALAELQCIKQALTNSSTVVDIASFWNQKDHPRRVGKW